MPVAVDFSAYKSKLAKSIKLNEDGSDARNLVKAIGDAHDEYRKLSAAYSSPKSRILEIKRLQKQGPAKIADNWGKLNFASQAFLRVCGVTPNQSESAILQGLSNAISALEAAPAEVKVANVSMRVFVQRLVEIYAGHHPDAALSSYKATYGTKRQLRSFVKTALDAAGISYPDPSIHTDRFDDLLALKRII